jgi:GNAT superfamily N-acetyltransferase
MVNINSLSRPESIEKRHLLDAFTSREDVLDSWLKKRVLKNHVENASRTFVVHDDNRVIAYYYLAVGSVESSKAPGEIKRNMPNPIPVMVLGKLAVDRRYEGFGIARGLLKDVTLRTFNVSQHTGVRSLLVHALSKSARHFYKRFGFIHSPLDDITLMLPVADIEHQTLRKNKDLY